MLAYGSVEFAGRGSLDLSVGDNSTGIISALNVSENLTIGNGSDYPEVSIKTGTSFTNNYGAYSKQITSSSVNFMLRLQTFLHMMYC